MVRLASRMLRAISLGVFWRLAPSTMAIMRSRKVSPGSVVTRTISQSESTRVPPVTALRSPPLSRMTGALSPVMALSSTEAAPTITSPSAGMSSPASTSTRSPRAQQAGGHVSRRRRRARASASLWASTSLRALRRRVGLGPAPALGQGLGEVGEDDREPQQQRDGQGEARRDPSLMPASDSKNSTRVSRAPTHTTNITGLRTCTRGSSLRNEFGHGLEDEAAVVGGPLRPSRVEVLGLAQYGRRLVHQCTIIRCSTIGPRASAGKKLSAPTTMITAISRPDEQRAVGAQGAGALGDELLLGQRAGDGQRGQHHPEAADQHGQAQRDVVEGGVGAQAGEGAAVVAGRRGEGVEDLAQAVRPGVGDARPCRPRWRAPRRCRAGSPPPG